MLDADLLKEFIVECTENLAQLDNDLVQLEQNPDDLEILKRIFRAIHTVKGTCGMFALTRLEKIAHAAEDVLGKMREGRLDASPAHIGPVLMAIDVIKGILAQIETTQKEPVGDDSVLIAELHAIYEGTKVESPVATVAPVLPATATETPVASDPAPSAAAPLKGSVVAPSAAAPKGDQSLRVNLDVLDRLMNLVGELVLTRNQLVQLTRGVDESQFLTPIHQLNRVTSSLQEAVMKTRMQPIGVAWQKLPRIIRDLQQSSGKKLELVMIGQETEIDRQILQAIQDPLVHCVRNSADHGIESPDARVAKGKSPTGTVTLCAFQEGGQIVIEVRDDGAGIDVEAVKRKALEKNLIKEEVLAQMSEGEILKLIFEPGFSTAKQVTEVSGRGVGMDVVRSNIEKIGGNVDISTKRDVGTVMKITIPLTLAIISALIVRVGEAESDIYALPQSGVLELVRIASDNQNLVETIHDAKFLRLRESLLPLIDMGKILEQPTDERASTHEFSVVVCQIGESRFGLMVQEIFDTQEVVVKAPGSVLRDLNIYSGATILGDGRVILILDIARISELGLSAIAQVSGQSSAVADKDENLRGIERTQMLLFEGVGGTEMGVPLALVSRLEEFPREKIEKADGRYFVQYRNSLLPLLGLDDTWTPQAEGLVSAVIFSDGTRAMGLAVRAIHDIVETVLSMEAKGTRPGLLGAAIVEGRATEIIDIFYFLHRAYPDWFQKKKGAQNGSKRRLLLVDDSSFFRELLRPLMESRGFFVSTAVDGDDALKVIDRAGPFDLIVTDIEMPKRDGWGLVQALSEKGMLGSCPVYALTTLNDESYKKKARDLGFAGYMVKFDQDQVIQTIEGGIG